MLGGVDPIIIIEIYTLVKDPQDEPGFIGPRLPIASKKQAIYVPQPPIPIYLSEELTGLYIDSEDKNIDIGTDTETLTNGKEADVRSESVV